MTEREQNAVFSSGTPTTNAPAGVPTQTMAEKTRQDFGFELPVERGPLPSNGKVYPAGSSLHGADFVDLLPMTARHEDILSNRALHKKGTVITELLRASLQDKSIDPRMLLTGDRQALLVSIRALGYGNEYPIKYTCPECEAVSDHTFDLSQLMIKRLEIEPVTPGTNEFSFMLPKLQKRVIFRFLTGADEEEIVAVAAKQKKLGLSTDSNVTTTLQYTLISVDGVTDRSKLAQFVRQCPARDSSALRRYIRENEPGIDMTQEVVCPVCEHVESEVGVELTPEFFWPGSLR